MMTVISKWIQYILYIVELREKEDEEGINRDNKQKHVILIKQYYKHKLCIVSIFYILFLIPWIALNVNIKMNIMKICYNFHIQSILRNVLMTFICIYYFHT